MNSLELNLILNRYSKENVGDTAYAVRGESFLNLMNDRIYAIGCISSALTYKHYEDIKESYRNFSLPGQPTRAEHYLFICYVGPSGLNDKSNHIWKNKKSSKGGSKGD